MKKVIRLFSILIVVVALLNVYSYFVAYTVMSGNKFKSISEPFKQFIFFPKTAIDVFSSNELKGIPPTFGNPGKSKFEEFNKLNYDLYGLNAFYNVDEGSWDVKLFNFRNDSLAHQWKLKRDVFTYVKRKFRNSEPRGCILLPNRSLILTSDETKNLYRLDKNSDLVWHNKDKIYHHAINLDADTNIWACSGALRAFKDNRKPKRFYYRDDFITKIDFKTGKLLFDKSVSDIFIENGYKNFVYGFSNEVSGKSHFDPLHLNDIQPILKDGPYWKKGDLLLSLRNRSLIVLYRPKTNKILRLIYGPLLHQHDVDIQSDSTITVFNNNITGVGVRHAVKGWGAKDTIDHSILYSEIISYNMADSSFTILLKDQFLKERISTWTEGLHHINSKGDVYIESQNSGKCYLLNNESVLLKKRFDASIEGMFERPHWLRVYEDINF